MNFYLLYEYDEQMSPFFSVNLAILYKTGDKSHIEEMLKCTNQMYSVYIIHMYTCKRNIQESDDIWLFFIVETPGI